MDIDILKTLEALNACHGPSGDEENIADTIETLARPYADEISRDIMGNLIVHKKGAGPKIMFAAHMDSTGFIVTHIDDNGFLRVGQLGSLSPRSCLHTTVRFKNGVKGVVALDRKADAQKMTLTDLCIDIGAKNRAEAEKLVKLGDTAVFDRPVSAMGDRLVSPYMDNRISCVVLLMALSQLTERKNDLYFVFTVQEEVGTRGARPAAYGVAPDYGIAVDVTATSDELNDDSHGATSVLGGGAAIKVMDGSVICHPQMVKRLEDLTGNHQIKAQPDVLRYGGTDAGAIRQAHGGVCTGGVSVPCRYIHSPAEMVDTGDVEACAALLVSFAQCDL